METPLVQSLLYSVVPILLGTIAGFFLARALGRLPLSYDVVELLPWRTVVGVLIAWLGFAATTVVIVFGLGIDGNIIGSSMLALAVTTTSVLVASLESLPLQRAIGTGRSVAMALCILMIAHVSWRVGAGGIGPDLMMIGQPGYTYLPLIHLASILLCIDIVGGLLQFYLGTRSEQGVQHQQQEALQGSK